MNSKTIAAAAAALLLVASATAVEMNLTDEEKAKCAAEGGCVFASVSFIRQQLEQAFQAGYERGRNACFSRKNET